MAAPDEYVVPEVVYGLYVIDEENLPVGI